MEVPICVTCAVKLQNCFVDAWICIFWWTYPLICSLNLSYQIRFLQIVPLLSHLSFCSVFGLHPQKYPALQPLIAPPRSPASRELRLLMVRCWAASTRWVFILIFSRKLVPSCCWRRPCKTQRQCDAIKLRITAKLIRVAFNFTALQNKSTLHFTPINKIAHFARQRRPQCLKHANAAPYRWKWVKTKVFMAFWEPSKSKRTFSGRHAV